MRTPPLWIAGASLVTHACNGYVLMLRKRPAVGLFIHKSPGYVRASVRAVSLNATANNEEDTIEKMTENQREEKNEDITLNTTNPVSQFFVSLTRPVRKVLRAFDLSFPFGAHHDDGSRRKSKAQANRLENEFTKPSNVTAAFWRHFKLPHPREGKGGVDGETRKASDSSLTNETVQTQPTSVVMRTLQQLIKPNGNTYPFFSTDSDVESSSTSISDSPKTSAMKPKRPQRHHDTSVVVRFIQRLFDRNGATPTLPTKNSTLVSTFNATDQPIHTPEQANDGVIVFEHPVGPRWAIPASTTNFTGKWKPIVSPEFKQQYDEYLKNCSQPFVFRSLCLNFVGMTREEVKQDGQSLQIRGTSPVGVWERTLVSSGSDQYTADYEPFNVTFLDPDKDMVSVEAWWAENGTVHKSWLRGKPRACGGEFESTRYMEPDNDVLVCESVFHPSGAKGFRPAFVKWRFEREE